MLPVWGNTQKKWVIEKRACLHCEIGKKCVPWEGVGTRSKDLSNESKTIAVNENVTSLQPVKDGNAKNITFLENKNEVTQSVV